MAKDQSPLVFNLRFGTADGEMPDDLRVRSGSRRVNRHLINNFSNMHLSTLFNLQILSRQQLKGNNVLYLRGVERDIRFYVHFSNCAPCTSHTCSVLNKLNKRGIPQ